MKSLLFRKMNYLGKYYYQLYKIDDNFVPSSEFCDFESNDKEYLYAVVDEKSEIDERFLNTIYLYQNKKLKLVTDSSLFDDVSYAFEIEKEYDNLDENLKDIVKHVMSKQKDKFNLDSIIALVKRIKYNKEIIECDISIDKKNDFKKNIIFLGDADTDRNQIIDSIEEKISIPYADIKLSEKEDENIANIFKQLYEKEKDKEEITNGIVFIRDKNEDDVLHFVKETIKRITSDSSFITEDININEIYEKVLDLFQQNEFKMVKSLINRKDIKYDNKKIDFRNLTFVFLLTVSDELEIDDEDINYLLESTGCEYSIFTKKMTYYQKLYKLLSKDGLLNEYKKYFKSFNKTFMYDEDAIEFLVSVCDEENFSMNKIDEILRHIIKKATIYEVDDFILTQDIIEEELLNFVSYKEVSKETIVNEGLKPIYERILKKVVGQDSQVKNILYTILENRRMANNKELEEPKQYIKNILLRGESGGGKTFIINNIAKELNIPCYVADATQYTEAGYVGLDVTNMLVNLYHEANNDLEQAEKGILVIDEIDKKTGSRGNSDVSRGAVLNSLLKIIEGAKIPIDVGNRMMPEEIIFDTSRLTVICSGAFEGIEEYRDERVKKELGNNRVGFSNEKKEVKVDRNIIDKDYVEYGMIRQFMARIPVIVNLNKNTKESLKNIMINSKASALKIEAFILKNKGIDVEYTEDFYDRLAEEAISLNIGARGIDKALQRVLSNIHIEDIDENEISKIIFNKDVIDNPEAIVLVPRKTKTKKKNNPS